MFLGCLSAWEGLELLSGFGEVGWTWTWPLGNPQPLLPPIPQEFLPEGTQSHLGRLVPKLQEVNRCLGDLLSTTGKVRAADKQLVVVCVRTHPVPPLTLVVGLTSELSQLPWALGR